MNTLPKITKEQAMQVVRRLMASAFYTLVMSEVLAGVIFNAHPWWVQVVAFTLLVPMVWAFTGALGWAFTLFITLSLPSSRSGDWEALGIAMKIGPAALYLTVRHIFTGE